MFDHICEQTLKRDPVIHTLIVALSIRALECDRVGQGADLIAPAHFTFAPVTYTAHVA
jgi:hypothetical protein